MNNKSTNRILLVVLGAIVSVKDIVQQAIDGVKTATDSLAAKGEANRSAVDELLTSTKKEGKGLLEALLVDARRAFNEEVHGLAKKIVEKTESPPKR